jgi:hypothetical protein
MKLKRAVLLGGALLLAGCQSPPPAGTAAAPATLDKTRSVEITPADDAFGRQRAAEAPARAKRNSTDAAKLTEGELYELPKFTVSRKGFVNFGLSVVTNVEVTVGGKIEWMRVGVILPGRPAARQGLLTGMEILAIDGIPIAQLSREDMLHALFEREAGEHVRLLIYARQFGSLPRFVVL